LFVNEIFNNIWLERGGPTSWAPRSPDLSPLDFFLWRHLKTNIYKTTVKDLDDLKTRIIDEIKIIKKGTLPDFFRQL